MKLARLLALVVAVGLAAVAVWIFTKPPEGTGQRPASGTAPAQGTAAVPTFEPEPGRSGARPANGPAPAQGTSSPAGAPSAPLMPTALPDTGTPVPPGTEVAVHVPWKRGERNRFRYEIEDLTLARDRESGNTDPSWIVWRVLLEVVDGDGSGAARLRLTVESLRIRGFQANGLPFDVDSRIPDNGLLDDPNLARRVRPAIALLNVPLEFRLDASGNVVDVDGEDEWRERFLTEVQRIQKGAVNDAPDAPTREGLIDLWSEFLFPRTGGGKLVAGTPRDWQRRQPYVTSWAIVWKGKVDVTRDDPDAFRVDVRATPSAEPTGVAPTTDFAAGIVAMRASTLGDGYRAAYRFGRSPGALVEAQIDATYMFATSRKAGGGPGQPQYAPRYTEMLRRAIVRRTAEE
jgi:hypothetical protein